jgi:hypothetical protein
MILLFESLHMLNVINKVLDFLEYWQSLCRDYVPKILFNLHSDFNLIKRIEAVVNQFAFECQSFVIAFVPAL